MRGGRSQRAPQGSRGAGRAGRAGGWRSAPRPSGGSRPSRRRRRVGEASGADDLPGGERVIEDGKAGGKPVPPPAAGSPLRAVRASAALCLPDNALRSVPGGVGLSAGIRKGCAYSAGRHEPERAAEGVRFRLVRRCSEPSRDGRGSTNAPAITAKNSAATPISNEIIGLLRSVREGRTEASQSDPWRHDETFHRNSREHPNAPGREVAGKRKPQTGWG